MAPAPAPVDDVAMDDGKAADEERQGAEDLELEDLKPLNAGAPLHWPWYPLPAGMANTDALALLGEVGIGKRDAMMFHPHRIPSPSRPWRWWSL